MIKTGTVTFGAKEILFAEKVAGNLKRIAEVYEGAYKRGFIAAIKKLTKKEDLFDFNVFIERMKVNRGMVYDCANVSQAMQMIEDIYNFRSRNKVSLKYLSDD